MFAACAIAAVAEKADGAGSSDERVEHMTSSEHTLLREVARMLQMHLVEGSEYYMLLHMAGMESDGHCLK